MSDTEMTYRLVTDT